MFLTLFLLLSFLFYKNPPVLLAENSGCYQVVDTINVHITKYSPKIGSNTCDASTGGGAATADGTGSFKMYDGRLRWIKSDGSKAEDYIFAQPTDDRIVAWRDREKYGIVIPGFNSGKPILVRDHYRTGYHVGENYLDLFLPCGDEYRSFPDGNYSVQKVDLSKPISDSTDCLVNTTTSIPDLTIIPPNSKCVVSANGSSAPALTEDDEAEDLESIGFWSGLWNWLWGKFKKTDYNIGQQRPLNDMSTFGVVKTKGYKKKQSFIGSRVTSSQGQDCLKGKVIRKVILNLDSYSNHNLAKICLDSGNGLTNCQNKSIKDLAHYFVQLQKNFYCDENNNFINIDQNVKNAVNSDPNFQSPIPDYQLDCYQQIYNSFYLSPKDETNTKSDYEENIKTMVKSSLFSQDQDTTKSNKEMIEQLNKNLSPEGQDGGFYGLRPDKEQ